jgi:hypothetical protein
MMQLIPRWQITVTHSDQDLRPIQFWINETHLGNVLRQVATMQFTESGLVQPTKITIEEVNHANTSTSITSTK